MIELGFTLLFVLKKWFEGKPEVEDDLQEKLLSLKDQALNGEGETFGIDNLTTFFKDLVLGFVFLCKRIFH